MAKFKKVLCLAVSVGLMLSVTGCGGDKKETSQGGEMPDEVSVFVGRSISLGEEMVDYNDVTSFKKMEELTGVHVNWTIPPASGFDEKFKLMIASNKFSDVIVANWKEMGAQKYKNDGVIISLNDYKEYMPNYVAYLDSHPEFAKDCVTSDGEILYMPYIREDRELNVFMGPLIRQDWLDKLNLQTPTTADELYTVLKAFKEQDPNGNGEADEIPMTGYNGSEGICHLLAMFDTAKEFYIDNGKVKYGIMEPEFEDGISYIAKLFAEGLIDPDYVFQERAKADGKITNDKAGFMFSYQPTTISNTMAEKNPVFKFAGIPNLKNKEGEKATDMPAYISSVLDIGAAISTQCKNPIGVVKWLDSFYSDEGIEAMNFGIEEQTYTKEGENYNFTDEIMNNPEYSVSRSFGRNIGVFNSYFPTVQKWESYSQSLSSYGKEAIETWSDVNVDRILPNITFTEEEKSEITQKMNQIKTYVDERIDCIILGQESVSDIQSVRERIKQMGMDDVLKIYQDAYDRYENAAAAL